MQKKELIIGSELRIIARERIYLVPVQRVAFHESPNDMYARCGFEIRLRSHDLRPAQRSDRIAQRHGLQPIQVAGRDVVVRDACNALDLTVASSECVCRGRMA